MSGTYEFPPKLVWANGARSSVKVSVLAGIGSQSALPCLELLGALLRNDCNFAIWASKGQNDSVTPRLGVVLPHLLVGKKLCVFVLCDLVKTD